MMMVKTKIDLSYTKNFKFLKNIYLTKNLLKLIQKY